MSSVLAYSQVSQATVGYYPSWHSSATTLQTLYNSGAANKLNYLIYAFADVDANGNCSLNSGDGTLYSATQNAYTSANSVDGTADSSSDAYQGDFHQMLELKQQLASRHISIKILLSVGGASYSGPSWATGSPTQGTFSQAARSYKNFASSCVNTFLAGYPGLFDGFDIDWEYPGTGVEADGKTTYDDKHYYTLLMNAFKTQMATYAQQKNIQTPFTLTAAIGPQQSQYGWKDIDFVDPYTDTSVSPNVTAGAPISSVNFFNVMAYEYEGTGAPQSIAPFASNQIPANMETLHSTGGVPVNKIVIGIPFYGVHWENLPAYNNPSLNTLLSWNGSIAENAGSAIDTDYWQVPVGAPVTKYDATTDSYGSQWGAWTYVPGYTTAGGTTTNALFNYDDPATIAAKAAYVTNTNNNVGAAFGGLMAWDLSKDTPTSSLLCSMESGLTGSNSCGLRFVSVTPCRLVDTRSSSSYGTIGAGGTSTYPIASLAAANSGCSVIPQNAQAYSLNVTIVPKGALEWLTAWPTGQAQPNASTINSDGRIKATAAIVSAGTGGQVNVYAHDQTDVILDINGYFVPVANDDAVAQEFYPLAPCRIADTRGNGFSGQYGPPTFTAGLTKKFQMAGECGIPPTATSYSLNFTVVPTNTLGYLTTWPTQSGSNPPPKISTLNASTHTVVANAAVVSPGIGANAGSISVYTTDATDVIIDTNGYFAPAGSGSNGANGLSLYPMTPCRVLDTRLTSGPFQGTQPVSVSGSSCPVPSSATGYVFTATVVPPASLGWLSLWPDSTSTPPSVSTLNAYDGAVTSNLALVPTNNGSINAYTSNSSQLILDVSGYFAQ